MKTPLLSRFIFPVVLGLAPSAWAVEPGALSSWRAQSLGEAIAYMLIFAAVGIVTAIAGYKIFDKCTPGNLHKEILENKNVAAAIVAGAVIIGVSIIVAVAMVS